MREEQQKMGQWKQLRIFIALGAGALYLLAYLDILSHCSNDGKQSLELFSLHIEPFRTAKVASAFINVVPIVKTRVIRVEPPLFIPGSCRGLNASLSINIFQS